MWGLGWGYGLCWLMVCLEFISWLVWEVKTSGFRKSGCRVVVLEDVWAVSCVFRGSVLALGAPEPPAA